MAKLKVQGNASGTGVVTLTAPNTNTDRTITLPDGDISLGVGIDDNATSTAITINSSKYVGIGTTSPVLPLHVSRSVAGTNDLVILSNENTAIGNKAGIIFAPSNGITGAKIEAEAIEDFSVSVNRTADLKVFTRTNGTLFENARFLAAGGITFNGDTAAANALDDYEEGTWTPAVVTGTVGTSDASYIKVGNIVTATFTLSAFSDRTSTAVVEITGLPFSGKTARHVGSFMGRYTDVSANNLYMATTLKLHVYGNTSGGWVQLRHSDLNNTGSQIYCSITYQT